MSIAELKRLSKEEEVAFELVREGKVERLEELIEAKKVRVNCLDKDGMNLLDQACFKGNEEMLGMLLRRGANVDNRAHDQGYTSLMFAALSGKPSLCQRLLDAGARAHAQNSIGKSASELAAFVGQFECVSVISSYVSLEDIERIVNPKNPSSEEKVYPKELVHFIHNLTKTHEIHPVRLIFNVMDEEVMMEHRAKVLSTIDRIFEKQLRCKEPNEIMSLKLWLTLFTLRELIKFMQQQHNDPHGQCSSKAASLFAKHLLQMNEVDLVRPVEERFLRNSMLAFPYKQSMLYSTISKCLGRVEFGQPPSAFNTICQALFGPRFVETAQFCIACGTSSSQKRCKGCKSPYCSEKCQKFDWSIHKKVCEAISKRRDEEQLIEDVNKITLST